MTQMFLEGGMGMYAVLAMTLLTGAFATLSLVVSAGVRFAKRFLWPARILAFFAVLGSLLPVATGAMAWQWGLSQAWQAIASAPVDLKDEMLAQAVVIAAYALEFGALGTVLAAAPAVLALLVALPPFPVNYEDF